MMFKFLRFAVLMALPLISVSCEPSDSDDEGDGNKITDTEGNTYKTVTIGSQTWFAENLKTKHFRNGDEIPTLDHFPDGNYPVYQWPAGGDEANVELYGRLYTQAVLTDSRGVCPEGWHAPSDAEFIQMEKELGLVYDQPQSGQIGTNEGGKMKEAGTAHWKEPNTGATNESGFTALPAGAYTMNSGAGGMGDYASFWTTTMGMGLNAWTHELNKSFEKIYRYDSPITIGKSCRCVMD
ncbi:MAG TPA: fibrobacter succinogenes major paralogous domain-containing protein [Bacteroidales bacterium]|nr:fibrobacter succinogenes major paralogous domain-containing protein [Bacteroidales bacterium]